jgi:hypothetical protein
MVIQMARRPFIGLGEDGVESVCILIGAEAGSVYVPWYQTNLCSPFTMCFRIH